MKVQRLSTLIWLTVVILVLCELVNAANGASGSSGGGKFSFFSRFRKPKQPPPPSLIERIGRHVQVPDHIKQMWDEGVSKGWINAETVRRPANILSS